jgi:lysophospholipase L1-like esterase
VDSVHFAPRIVNKYKPRIVAFYAGDNDVGSGKSPEQVASDFKDFVKVVRKDLPKTKIVYISIKPSIKRWALWDKVSAANKLIAEECKKNEGLTFLDVGPAMLGADGKPIAELFVADGLHLSEKGYEIWTRLLKPHLE